MKKKVIKIIIFVIMLIILFSIFALNVYAYNWTSLEGKMEAIKKTDQIDSSSNKFATVMNMIISLIRIAGAGIAVIMVTITGIKYMMSSASDKAEYKKALITMLIGAALLVGATQLIAAVGDLAIKMGSN